ncbi:MAG: glucose-6-phosphate dehydrogenase, partial [Trichococcus flocculiformis]
RIIDAIRETWDSDNEEIPKYAARTMGPKEAFDLLKKEKHEWVWTPDEWYRERGLLKG